MCCLYIFFSSIICNLCYKRNIYLSQVTIASLISDRIRMSGTQVFSHRSGVGIRAVAVPGLVCVCRYYYLFTPSSKSIDFYRITFVIIPITFSSSLIASSHQVLQSPQSCQCTHPTYQQQPLYASQEPGRSIKIDGRMMLTLTVISKFYCSH